MLKVTKIKPDKEKIEKPKKQRAEKASKQAANFQMKVPFKNCYEEMGIIETENGEFSVAYKVDVNENTIYRNVEQLREGLRKILDAFGNKYSYQIFIQNSTVSIDSFLDKVHLPEKGNKKLDDCIENYNDMLDNNAEIGHNNYERSIIFVIKNRSDTIDEAVEAFKAIDMGMTHAFKQVYKTEIHRQSLTERLSLIYDIFHPDDNSSFQKTDKPVKSIVAPSTYEFNNMDYIKVGDMYARTLFINSIPAVVSHSLLSDLMSTSSNSILSLICEPIDTELGYKVSKQKVEKNTDRQKVFIRNTVEDRKNKKTEIKEKRINENENEYFYEQASHVLGEAVENKDTVLMTTILITLFANTKEELDRDTKLLRLSAMKFAVQIRVCEEFQDDAFQSIFPVCSVRVNTARVLSSSTIATLQPFNTKKVAEQRYIFCGLNSISDNFVMLNRDICKTGIISGVPHSGKTFAVKREAVGRLMNSNDEVLIITDNTKPYEKVVQLCDAKVYDTSMISPFLFGNSKLQRQFMESLLIYELGIDTLRIQANDKKLKLQAIKEESERLAEFANWNAAAAAINENRGAFPYFLNMVAETKYRPVAKVNYASDTNQLKIVNAKNTGDLVIAIGTAAQYVANKAKEGKTVHVFVESIDNLFYTTAGSDFMCFIYDAFKAFNGTITCVVQDSVRIWADMDATIEFNFFLEKVDYYKLFSQGPIEKKNYAKKLNIPTSLQQYVSDREPGEGIIITPAENVAFNDRFENKTNSFYALFY